MKVALNLVIVFLVLQLVNCNPQSWKLRIKKNEEKNKGVYSSDLLETCDQFNETCQNSFNENAKDLKQLNWMKRSIKVMGVEINHVEKDLQIYIERNNRKRVSLKEQKEHLQRKIKYIDQEIQSIQSKDTSPLLQSKISNIWNYLNQFDQKLNNNSLKTEINQDISNENINLCFSGIDSNTIQNQNKKDFEDYQETQTQDDQNKEKEDIEDLTE